MSEVQPQPGDKVRVTSENTAGCKITVEGEVSQNPHSSRQVWIKGYGCWDVEDGNTVEIVERADDPSRDEIGTVAEIDGVGVPFVKVRTNRWEGVGGGLLRNNEDMISRRVTGAVPGTPAAQAQQPNTSTKRQCAWWHDTRQCPAWNHEDSDYCPKHTDERVIAFGTEEARWAYYEGNPVPLVVQYGDPEPDRSKKFTCATGVRLECDPTGLWNGFIWSNLARYRFPLTEVVIEP